MPPISDLILPLLTSPWLLLVVLAVCIIDGFFPPVPSETTVVAALAAGLAAGSELPWAVGIVAVAAIGAMAGDSIAYWIGRRVGVDRFAWMRRPRVRRSTDWIAERVLATPATLVLVGRYIPVGRVAVNAMAGASGLRYRRFLPLSIAAGLVWAAMCWAIAAASAAWLGDPLLAALAGVGIMLVLGVLFDLGGRVLRAKRA